MEVRQLINEFADYTTLAGFSRIVASNTKSQRIAWIIVFTTTWILFTVQMCFVLRSYFEYPKKLKTEILPVGFPFPAITLCNLGSFDFYTVYRLSQGIAQLNMEAGEEKYDSTASEEDTQYEDYPEDYPDEENNSYLNDTFLRAIYKYYGVWNKSSTKLNETLHMAYVAKMFSRTNLAANISPKMLRANGFREDEFIVKCTYRNEKCIFKQIFDPYFFNCYTFTAPNATSSADDDPAPLFEGIQNGFTAMILAGAKMLKEVDNPDFTGMPGIYSKDSALSGAGGVRVVIHPPGTKPFPMTEGYDVPPNQMATLSLTPKRRKRLDQPYGHCNDKYPFLNNDEQNHAGPYRRTACEKVCIQNHIYRECNCYENTLPADIDILTDLHDDITSLNDSKLMHIRRKRNFIKLQDYCFTEHYLGGQRNSTKVDPCKMVEKCSATNEFHKCFKFYSSKLPTCDDEKLFNLVKKIKCADDVKDRVMANATLLSQCGCHPSCNEALYDVAYSLSQWPSQGIDGDTVYHEIMKEQDYIGRFSSREKRDFYDNYVDEDIKRALKDFSKINVFVSDADVFLTAEEPAMTLTQLISDIGGQLGVWIGVSVLTIAEVLEILILTLMEFCRGRSKEEKPKEVETHLNSLATDIVS